MLENNAYLHDARYFKTFCTLHLVFIFLQGFLNSYFVLYIVVSQMSNLLSNENVQYTEIYKDLSVHEYPDVHIDFKTNNPTILNSFQDVNMIVILT